MATREHDSRELKQRTQALRELADKLRDELRELHEKILDLRHDVAEWEKQR